VEKFRDFAIKYLKIAEKDLERAKRNLDFDDYEATIFYAQQCVEKSVKSILEIHGIFTKEHEISTQFRYSCELVETSAIRSTRHLQRSR